MFSEQISVAAVVKIFIFFSYIFFVLNFVFRCVKMAIVHDIAEG